MDFSNQTNVGLCSSGYSDVSMCVCVEYILRLHLCLCYIPIFSLTKVLWKEQNDNALTCFLFDIKWHLMKSLSKNLTDIIHYETIPLVVIVRFSRQDLSSPPEKATLFKKHRVLYAGRYDIQDDRSTFR